MLYLVDVHATSAVSPSSSVNSILVVEIVVPIAIVALLVVAFFVRRWMNARKRFDKLKDVHTDYVRRATAAAKDETQFDATTRSRLSVLLTPTTNPEDWDYRPAATSPRQAPSTLPPSKAPATLGRRDVEMHSLA
jgi:FtsZ-interacting cell division protein ZipA